MRRLRIPIGTLGLDQPLDLEQFQRGTQKLQGRADDALCEMPDLAGEIGIGARSLGQQAEGREAHRFRRDQAVVLVHGGYCTVPPEALSNDGPARRPSTGRAPKATIASATARLIRET